MENKKRKYYKIYGTRQCPFPGINGSYSIEEYVYAYSEEGAINTFVRYHSHSFGRFWVDSVEEISKEEFRGQHVIVFKE